MYTDQSPDLTVTEPMRSFNIIYNHLVRRMTFKPFGPFSCRIEQSSEYQKNNNEHVIEGLVAALYISAPLSKQ